jgi:aspartate kinase
VTERPAPIVYKFGGTSVGDGTRIRHVARLAAEGPRPLVVVVSAMAGVTDALQRLVAAEAGQHDENERTVRELRSAHVQALDTLLGTPAREARDGDRTLDLASGSREAGRDALESRLERLSRVVSGAAGLAGAMRADDILATGEDLSQQLVVAGLDTLGVTAEAVDARELLVTDSDFGHAAPDRDATRAACSRRLAPLLEDGTVAVVQGFVGATPEGHTTTLGRGGSDFSAAILGGALAAESVHIWTDVRGVLSGDPRQVEAPRLLTEIGFEELVELAWAGAKVVHPVAAKWAVAEGVPMWIRDTFHPDDPGTRVRHDVRGAAEIAAVTVKRGVALIKVRSHPVALPYGFLARVFGVLGRHRLEVDLVATSHSSTAFTIDDQASLDEVAAELGTFADVEVRRPLATITLVGHGLLAEPGVGGQVFAVVGDTPVRLVSQASDVSLSLVVDEAAAPALVRRLHTKLIEQVELRNRRTA